MSTEPRRGPLNREVYRQRNLIERAINRIKQFRRIATRYEKLAQNYTGKGQSLFKEGISCEVFKSGATGLQKGRLKAKLVLEFCPDKSRIEEKSPLDDIRQMME